MSMAVRSPSQHAVFRQRVSCASILRSRAERASSFAAGTMDAPSIAAGGGEEPLHGEWDGVEGAESAGERSCGRVRAAGGARFWAGRKGGGGGVRFCSSR